MAGKVTTAEARSNFSDLVNRVSYGGERILIDRRGKSVAAIVPLEDLELLERLEDKVDLELALRALAENDGITSWEDAVKELDL